MTPELETPLGLPAAFAWAERAHRGQIRKKTQSSVLSHLLAVCALVLENGGDEEEAMAALLHDAPEDCDGSSTLDEIRALFGDRIAHIVAGCTDSLKKPKPPWEVRKRAYLEHLPAADDSTLLVSLADKVHNVRSLVVTYRSVGDDLWQRSSTPAEEMIWYYSSLLQVFEEAASSRCGLLVGELRLALKDFERIARPERPEVDRLSDS